MPRGHFFRVALFVPNQLVPPSGLAQPNPTPRLRKLSGASERLLSSGPVRSARPKPAARHSTRISPPVPTAGLPVPKVDTHGGRSVHERGRRFFVLVFAWLFLFPFVICCSAFDQNSAY